MEGCMDRFPLCSTRICPPLELKPCLPTGLPKTIRSAGQGYRWPSLAFGRLVSFINFLDVPLVHLPLKASAINSTDSDVKIMWSFASPTRLLGSLIPVKAKSWPPKARASSAHPPKCRSQTTRSSSIFEAQMEPKESIHISAYSYSRFHLFVHRGRHLYFMNYWPYN